MIHFALGVAAFLFICWLVLQGLGIIGMGFSESKGCGCAAIVGVGLVAILLIAFFG